MKEIRNVKNVENDSKYVEDTRFKMIEEIRLKYYSSNEVKKVNTYTLIPGESSV